jgi:hypothetical protein
VIQLTFAAAVHEQPVEVTTLNELFVLPDGGRESVVGSTVYAHEGLTGGGGTFFASCVMRTVRSAMVSDELRASPGLAPTLTVTDPGPFPVDPGEIVIHGAPARALHVQPLAVVTPILAVPPDASKFCSVSDNSNWHGAASWRICARTPLTTTSPCLAVAVEFAATFIVI